MKADLENRRHRSQVHILADRQIQESKGGLWDLASASRGALKAHTPVILQYAAVWGSQGKPHKARGPIKGRTKGRCTWALAAASRPARECLCSSKACSFSYSSLRRSWWKNWKSCSWGILGRRGPLGRLHNTQHTVTRQEKRKDYAFRHLLVFLMFNEKPRIMPGCSGTGQDW